MASVSGREMSDLEADQIVEDCGEGSTMSSTGSYPRRSSEEVRDDSFLYYYRIKQWLEAEVEQSKARLHAIKGLESVSEENPAPIRTQELQGKLTRLSTDRNVLKSMLQSVQLGQTMVDVMFQEETDSKLQKTVTELVERSTTSVSNVLRIHKENLALQSSLANLKEECLVLRQEVRELMHKLKQLQDTKESRTSARNKDLELERAKKERDTLTANLEMTQCVLQGLIFGSGLNWAADKELCDLVLSLGRPVEELLKEQAVESETPP